MVFRLMTGFNLAALCVFTGLAGTSAFADPGNSLVNTNQQDDSRVLPQENAVTFVASDPRVRLQLVRLADSSDNLVGTPVTVIDPAGEAERLTADAQGVVILSDVQAGLHAVVSAGAAGHVAVPLILREVPEERPAGDASVVSNAPISTVQLPLINLDPREVVRVANSFLPPTSAPAAAVGDLDSQYISAGEVVQSHRYRVQLNPGGRIEGRIFTLMSGAGPQAGLGGTNLMVYSGNRLVARTVSDDQGRFVVENLRPGIHGLIAAGPAGYAAFAFDVFGAGELVDQGAGETLVSSNGADQTLVTMNQPGIGGASLPIVVIPPPMVPGVVNSIAAGTPPGAVDVPLDPTVPGFAPVPGAGGGVAGGAGGGFGGGGGGLGGAAGGGLGGAGGLLALGGIGAAVAAAAGDSEDDRPIVFPPVATAAEPGTPTP